MCGVQATLSWSGCRNWFLPLGGALSWSGIRANNLGFVSFTGVLFVGFRNLEFMLFGGYVSVCLGMSLHVCVFVCEGHSDVGPGQPSAKSRTTLEPCSTPA